MLKKDKLILEKYNGIPPICGCGCGEKTIYDASSKDFGKFKRGHQTRVNKGYFGDPKNPKRVNAIIKTRKDKFASGEYDHILKQIHKPKSEQTKQKISKSGKGVSRPKKEGFGIGRIQSFETKQKMSKTHKEKWETGNIGKKKHYTSKLEKTFSNILDLLNIQYQQHFYAKEIKAFYDFYLPQSNTIIEVDGDFWHCNPNSKHNIPKYITQEKNIIRDKEKNEWAKQNGFKLLRFWEKDIHNNIKQVKKILLEII